jgi:transposase
MKCHYTTIYRQLKILGYKSKKYKRRPLLKQKHKESRKRFAIHHLNLDTNFSQVIFSDEKKFRWDGPDGWRSYWAGIDEKAPPAEYSKDYGQFHGVMVWVGMSAEGVLHVERMRGKVDAASYADMICGDALPHIHATHGTDFVFQQDNASPHRAQVTVETFREREIKVLEWPSLSPDLNPVENLWSQIVRRVYSDARHYSSDEELWLAVEKAAREIPPQSTRDLIDGMKKRLLKVLELDGRYIQDKC